MNINTILKTANPTSHWTFENFGGNTVYDEYNTFSLANNNAILDVVGPDNQNFSDKCVNLRGGHLEVVDTTAFNDRLASRDFSLHFLLRVPQQVTGFHLLVSKWTPTQQFMVGFESGQLIAKVQTGGGLVELNIDEPEILYSGRWNDVFLGIEADTIYFKLNSRASTDSGVTFVTNSDSIQQSTDSKFVIGDPVSPFTVDVYVTDVSITDSVSYLHNILYTYTRSDQDIILDLQPDYYFPIADSFELDPTQPVRNLGTRGSVYGYLKGADISEFSPVKPDARLNKSFVSFPVGGYFTIDETLNFNFDSDDVFFVGGTIDTYRSANSYSVDKNIYPMILYGNLDGNEYNLLLSFGAYYDDKLRFFTVAYDETGTEIVNTYVSTSSPDVLNTPGLVLYSLRKSSNSSFSYKRFAKEYNYTISYGASSLSSYTPPTTGYVANKFFLFNSSSNGYNELSVHDLVIFNRYLTTSMMESITPNRISIWMTYITELSIKYYQGSLYSLLSCGVNFDDVYERFGGGSARGLEYDTNGLVHKYPTHDALHNSPNTYTASNELVNIDDYFCEYRYSAIGVSNDNFTLSFFVENWNDADRFVIVRQTYNASTTDNSRFQFRMNSKNGVFDHGYIEFSMDNENPDYTLHSSSPIFKEHGYHHVAIVRKGTRLELWIDGELDTVKITPSIFDCSRNYVTPMFMGGQVRFRYITYLVGVNEHVTLPDNMIELLFTGFSDLVKGKTTLSGIGIKSKLASLDATTGNVIDSGVTNDDGSFEFSFTKDDQQHNKFILAIPFDETLTSNVIVHGPYKTNTVYSKLKEEVFEESMKDMILDFDPYTYYPLDDASGTQITDASANALHGVISGSGYLLGQDGPEKDSKSVYFDGVDSFVDLPDGFDDFTNGMTISFWASPTATQSWARYIELGNSAEDNHDMILLSRNGTTSNYQTSIYDSSGTLLGGITQGTIWNSLWFHVALRVKPTLEMEFFLNGTLVATTTLTALPSNVTRTINYIAKSSYASNAYFKGYMAHVAVFDYPIPDEEITKQAYRGMSSSVTTLKSIILSDFPEYYWTFDRLKTISEERQGADLTVNGFVEYAKNAVVINKGTIGNNYLYNDSVHVNDSNSNRWCVEFSFKATADQTDGILVSEWDTAAGAGTYSFMLSAGGELRCYIASTASFIPASGVNYTDGKWHHVVLVVDGNTYTLYVDGVSRGTVTSTNVFGTYRFTVGNDSTADASTYLESETHIDDLAIYGGVLTEVEIEEHYNQFVKKKDTI